VQAGAQLSKRIRGRPGLLLSGSSSSHAQSVSCPPLRSGLPFTFTEPRRTHAVLGQPRDDRLRFAATFGPIDTLNLPFDLPSNRTAPPLSVSRPYLPTARAPADRLIPTATGCWSTVWATRVAPLSCRPSPTYGGRRVELNSRAEGTTNTMEASSSRARAAIHPPDRTLDCWFSLSGTPVPLLPSAITTLLRSQRRPVWPGHAPQRKHPALPRPEDPDGF